MQIVLKIVFISLLLTNLWMVDAVRRILREPEVARAVQLLEEGAVQRVVADRLGVARSVIARLWRRYQETGRYTRRPGQGRPRITTAREDRYLQLLATRNRLSTARALENDFHQATGVHISDQTARNRLHDNGMRSRRPARGPILTVQHRASRLTYAREHRNWQLRNWSPVLFTDESRFHVSTCDRRVRVWRRAGERYADCNIVEHDHFGGGSIMVWGGICIAGRTELCIIDRGSMTAIRYRNEILGPIVRPFAGVIGPDFILMQDNARPHTARVAIDYLEQEGIDVMDWPARSPDLNPIEHVWDIIGRHVLGRHNPPTTVPQLRQALIEEWDAIPQNTIRRLIRSMPNRLEECLNARGAHTSY